ncbi:MAG: hypothetical protein ACRCZR_02200 [Cetobacterium sp.]
MKINKNEIENIIQKSELEMEEKKVMREVFSSFSSHYENFINHISERVYNTEYKDEERNVEICSIIVPTSKIAEMEKYGFKKIYEDEYLFFENENIENNLLNPCIIYNLYYAGQYFNKEKYLDKKYRGKIAYKGKSEEKIIKEIDYYLYDEEFENSQFEEKNKKVLKMMKNYGMKNKTGFYPFKTRMFCTYIFTELKLDEIELPIDFLLEENGLSEFKKEMIPMWNIDFEKIEPKITSKDSDFKTNYSFVLEKTDEYIVPLKEEDYEQIIEGNKLLIISTNSNEEFEKIKLNKIDKLEVQSTLMKIDKNCNIYSNNVNHSYYNKSKVSRIRTKADIESFINRYRELFHIKNYEISNKPLDIEKYFKSSFPTEEDLFNPEYKCKLYIKFSNENENIMYIDYLKFILDELRENYPEIHWIGGI